MLGPVKALDDQPAADRAVLKRLWEARPRFAEHPVALVGAWRFKVPMSRSSNLLSSASDPCLNAGSGSLRLNVDWAKRKSRG